MPNSHILSPTTDPFNPFGTADHQQAYTSMASLAFSTTWVQGGTTTLTPCHRPSRPLSSIGASPRCPTAQSAAADVSSSPSPYYRPMWRPVPAAVSSHVPNNAPSQRPPTSSNLSHVLTALLATRASNNSFSEGILLPPSSAPFAHTSESNNLAYSARPAYPSFYPTNTSSSSAPYAHMEPTPMITAPEPSLSSSFVSPFAGGDPAMGPVVVARGCIQREPALTGPSLDRQAQDLSETNILTASQRRRSSANQSSNSRPTSSLSSSSAASSSSSQLLSTSPKSTTSLSSMASSPPRASMDLTPVSRPIPTTNSRRPLSQSSAKGSTMARRHRSCSTASSTSSTDSCPSVASSALSTSPPAPASKASQQQQQRSKHSSLLPPHQHQQLQQQVNYKTEFCTRYQETGGHCPFGDRCQFAHEASELQRRPRSLTYKTRPCWSGDACLYQQNHQRCIYLHGNETPEMFDEQRGISFAKVQQICAKKALKQKTKPKMDHQRMSMPALPSPSMTAPPKNPLVSAPQETTTTTTSISSSNTDTPLSPLSSSRRRMQRSQTLPSMTPTEAAAASMTTSSDLPAAQCKQGEGKDHSTVAPLPPAAAAAAATVLQESSQNNDTAHQNNNGRVMNWLLADQAHHHHHHQKQQQEQPPSELRVMASQPQPPRSSSPASRRKPFKALSNLRTTSPDQEDDDTADPLASFPQGYDLVSDHHHHHRKAPVNDDYDNEEEPSSSSSSPTSLQAFQKPTFLSRSNRWSKSGAKKACPPKALSLSSLAEENKPSATRLTSPALALMHTLRTPTRPTAAAAAAAAMPPSCAGSAAGAMGTYDPFSIKMMMPTLPMSMTGHGPSSVLPVTTTAAPPSHPPLMNTNYHNKSMMMMMAMTTGFPGSHAAGASSSVSKTDRSLLFSPGTPLTEMIPVLGLEQLESWKDTCFDD